MAGEKKEKPMSLRDMAAMIFAAPGNAQDAVKRQELINRLEADKKKKKKQK